MITDIDETIKKMENIAVQTLADQNYSVDYARTFDQVIQLLRNQKPKAIEYRSSRGHTWKVCPDCGELVTRTCRFCSSCGRAISDS